MPDEKNGGWSEKQTGVTEDGKVVTFRTGTGDKAGQTLVGGGELSSKGLDKNHDHFGPDVSKESDHGNLANAPHVDDYTDQSYVPKNNEK